MRQNESKKTSNKMSPRKQVTKKVQENKSQKECKKTSHKISPK